jgi:hypothetical protein
MSHEHGVGGHVGLQNFWRFQISFSLFCQDITCFLISMFDEGGMAIVSLVCGDSEAWCRPFAVYYHLLAVSIGERHVDARRSSVVE